MRLKACLNGNRQPREHPALPVTPDELAQSAQECVQEGVFALHLHPRNAAGSESLDAADVAAALNAVQRACPGVPVGISSGFWILPDVEAQLAAARSWTVKPDFVSVNWHEPHALTLADELLKLGVGVEAGLWTVDAARAFMAWPGREGVTRVLVELLDASDTLADAHTILHELSELNTPKLLHGEGSRCWPMLREASKLGLDARIGLEDTLTLPDGKKAMGNSELVRVAF